VNSLLAGLRLLRLRIHWDEFAKRDPLWAVLTAPDKQGGGWTPEEFFRWGELEVAALQEQLAAFGIQLGGRSAFDFGCGVGRVTGPLADRFQEVVGVDISPRMLELARGYNRRGARCRFERGGADLRGFADSSFDFVYSKLVLQHMAPSEVRAYLPELVRLLRPAGALAFQLPVPVDDRVRGGRLKRLVPLPLARAYRRLRRLVTRGPQFPRMEVHGMAREDVLRLIESSGGRALAVVPDQSHGDESPGFLYIVQKPG
jgi:SAM-dependent methyltransferase